ncbi:hypothetical protein [Blastococcus sp. SYSU D01042]
MALSAFLLVLCATTPAAAEDCPPAGCTTITEIPEPTPNWGAPSTVAPAPLPAPGSGSGGGANEYGDENLIPWVPEAAPEPPAATTRIPVTPPVPQSARPAAPGPVPVPTASADPVAPSAPAPAQAVTNPAAVAGASASPNAGAQPSVAGSGSASTTSRGTSSDVTEASASGAQQDEGVPGWAAAVGGVTVVGAMGALIGGRLARRR